MFLPKLNIHLACITFVFAFLMMIPAARSESGSASACVSCHEDIWGEVKDSIHAKQGMSCHHCHGGDPSQKDSALAKAPGTGYIGIPDKKQLTQTCGTCHSDVAFMNPYGTRTDQLARYHTSAHGKALFEKDDKRVASCSDCHGYHDVLQVSDPASPVYPFNVPKTCATCHANEKLMSQYGLPADIFEKYKNSAHGTALLEKKDTGAAHCASCHGSHGAIPPGVSEIHAACGKCHINEQSNFLGSVHAGLAPDKKFLQCAACHGFHDIQPASPELFSQSCIRCHTDESPAFLVGKTIQGQVETAEQTFHTQDQNIQSARSEGIFTQDEEAMLSEMKTHLIEMTTKQHMLKEGKIAPLLETIESQAKEINNTLQAKRNSIRWRFLALIPLWIFIVIMVIAFILKYHRMDRNE